MALSPKESKWIMYPPVEAPVFLGFQTDVDPTHAQETSHVGGTNTFVGRGDKIQTRLYGTELFPDSESEPETTGDGIVSLYTFRLRTGENIMLRSYGTDLEWLDQATASWVNLRSSLSSADFGFAEFNVNANAESRLYMGNGVDDTGYWNGGHTYLNGALSGGETTITVDSTASFTATGSLRIGSTTVTYTGITPTTFTGVTGAPAAADDLPIAQAVVTNVAWPKGNILMAAQNRLFIVPFANTQIVQFSAYGDAASWSTNTVLSSTATSAGAFNLIEGGGEVNAMVQDEQNLYFLKDACTYAATLSDSFYTLQLLKPFDGRSRATGAIGRRGVFIGGNFVFIVTPDKKVKSLQRVEQIDFPQLVPISEIIQNTVDEYDFTSVTGISFREYAFFACKSSPENAVNDIVLVWNMEHNHWESPIVGWAVGEWAIYDDGTGEALYFGDATAPNVWKLTKDRISDGPYIINSDYKTKRFTFGVPALMKELDGIYLEGRITEETELTVTILFDEDGYSGSRTTTISGSESDYIFGQSSSNALGLNPFGVEVFGSNEDAGSLKYFRVYLNKNWTRLPFYNCQLIFSSSGQNQQWEIINYGFLVRQHSQPMDPELYRNFN